MTTRLNVNINDETAAFLRDRSAAEGRTVTEVVRRMASVYKFVADANENGDRLQLVKPDGSVSVMSVI